MVTKTRVFSCDSYMLVENNLLSHEILITGDSNLGTYEWKFHRIFAYFETPLTYGFEICVISYAKFAFPWWWSLFSR